jgi:RNA polymerase sigma factor (sigma-70 family)
MPHPDQKYIDALLTHNAPLLDELYQRFSGRIKTMVIHNHGSEGDARDIFQEALLSICNKARINGFILDCPFDAFLYIVCKNKWLSELRKKSHGRVTFQDTERYMIEQSSLALAEELELEQRREELLYKKLSHLGERCRDLLRLSWQKKTLQEVAEALKITYGYARRKKSECMGRLITLIKADPEFENLKREAYEKQ